MNRWIWLLAHALVAVVILALGDVLGGLALFKKMTIRPGLTMAEVVRAISYAGTVVLIWVTLVRLAWELRRIGPRAAIFGNLLLPGATLALTILAYSPLMGALRPILTSPLRGLYNWTFVLAITASAIWLAMSVQKHAQPLLNAILHPGR